MSDQPAIGFYYVIFNVFHGHPGGKDDHDAIIIFTHSPFFTKLTYMSGIHLMKFDNILKLV